MTKKKNMSPVSSYPSKTHQRGSEGIPRTGEVPRITQDLLQERLGFRGFTSRSTTPTTVRRGKSRSICLQTPSSSTVGFQLMLDPLYPWSTIASHLVTQAIYRGINSIDWLIIYQDLEDNTISREDEFNVARAILLALVVRRESFTIWDKRIKPLKPQRVLSSIKNESYFEDLDEDELDTIEEFLRIAGSPLKSERDLYHSRIVSQVKPEIPAEQYIGVGYKDHGHLPDPTVSREPVIEEWKPSLDCSLDRILELSKNFIR